MSTTRHPRFVLVMLLFMVLSISIVGMAPQQLHAAPNTAQYCGDLGEYTAWHWTGREWKRVLWVWKNGKDKPYPKYLLVHYDGQLVPIGQHGVDTSGSPQVDQFNGWVGYFISTRWAASHWGWNNDSRWRVTGCVEK